MRQAGKVSTAKASDARATVTRATPSALALRGTIVALLGIGAAAISFTGPAAFLPTGFVFLFSVLAGPVAFAFAVMAMRAAGDRTAQVAGTVAAILSGGLTAFWIYFWLNFEPS